MCSLKNSDESTNGSIYDLNIRDVDVSHFPIMKRTYLWRLGSISSDPAVNMYIHD
jgi:hypothetical protein